MPYAAHGYGGFFTLATLDRHYKENMTLDEAKDVLKKCIAEVRPVFRRLAFVFFFFFFSPRTL